MRFKELDGINPWLAIELEKEGLTVQELAELDSETATTQAVLRLTNIGGVDPTLVIDACVAAWKRKSHLPLPESFQKPMESVDEC